VTERTVAYYVERAKGGVGLIIVGGTRALPITRPTDRRYLNLGEETLLPSHYHLVEAVHSYGAKIAIQVGHPGSQVSLSEWAGEQPLSPSGVPQLDVSGHVICPPRPINKGEIYQIIEGFAKAIANARRVGYDIVEIHAANGYLLGAFMSPATNKRTDEFGGNVKNRMRFVTEIVQRAHQVTGDDFPIGVRFSADEFILDGITTQESPAMAKILEEAGAAYINISCGTYFSQHKMNDVMRMEEGWKLPIWVAIKQAVTIPTIAGGGNRNPEFCERLIDEGKADFVGMARQMLADPYWSRKAMEGRIEDLNRCISCLRCLYGLGGKTQVVRHCTVNPMWGREVDFIDGKPPGVKKKVMVIGGGPGGMEVARVASLRGHEVTLYEKNKELGGQLLFSAVVPGKKKVLWFRDYLATQIKKQGVKIELGSEVGPDIVKKAKPDVVIMATGARPLVPNIPGVKGTRVVTAWDILVGKTELVDKNVVILGGGMVGCETAEFLAKQGHNITIVEMLPNIAQDMEPINLRSLLDELKEYRVSMLVGQKVVEITDNGVTVINAVSGEKQVIQARQPILALGAEPEQSLAKALEGISDELYLIGDCQQPRTILEAVSDGFLIGHRL
jgi:2,4-dienoyl-CoA reductase-like NADH-dependent reductase (Old Yellow Enzyme family)/thioredoxin reductase